MWSVAVVAGSDSRTRSVCIRPVLSAVQSNVAARTDADGAPFSQTVKSVSSPWRQSRRYPCRPPGGIQIYITDDQKKQTPHDLNVIFLSWIGYKSSRHIHIDTSPSHPYKPTVPFPSFRTCVRLVTVKPSLPPFPHATPTAAAAIINSKKDIQPRKINASTANEQRSSADTGKTPEQKKTALSARPAALLCFRRMDNPTTAYNETRQASSVLHPCASRGRVQRRMAQKG